VIARYHRRHEFLCHPVMRQGINIERESDVFLSRIQDVLSARNASIIYQDCGLADILADFCGNGGDVGCRGDVTLVVVDMFCYGFQ
jgi:hypothetical protein